MSGRIKFNFPNGNRHQRAKSFHIEAENCYIDQRCMNLLNNPCRIAAWMDDEGNVMFDDAKKVKKMKPKKPTKTFLPFLCYELPVGTGLPDGFVHFHDNEPPGHASIFPALNREITADFMQSNPSESNSKKSKTLITHLLGT